MKNMLCLAILLACMAAVARSESAESGKQLVGTYSWAVPGSTWTLTLRSTGTYNLTTQGSVIGSKPKMIEVGFWAFDDFRIVLKNEKAPVSGTKGEYRRLYILRQADGRFVLVSVLRSDYIGQPVDQMPFRYVFLRSESEQAEQSAAGQP